MAGSASANRWSVTDLAVGAQSAELGVSPSQMDAQVAAVGVEIVEHAGDLQPGGIRSGLPPASTADDRELPAQDLRHQRAGRRRR